MPDSSIPITPGSGANVDTRTQADGEHREVVSVGDADAANTLKVNTGGDAAVSITSPQLAPLGIYAGVDIRGLLSVTGEPTSLLYDTFDVATIDAQRWATSGNVTPSTATGQLVVAPGTANSASSALASQYAFVTSGIGFLVAGWVASLETSQPTNPNTHRFWGFAQATSFAAATPVSDGAGFEVGIDGALQCVVYIGGTKYVVASTSVANISSSAQGVPGAGTAAPAGAQLQNFGPLTWPGGPRRWGLLFRPDAIFWYIDDQNVPVAYANYLNPNVASLPLRMAAVNTTSGTVVSSQLNVSACAVATTTAQNHYLSDPTYPWRQASVGKNGGLAVRGGMVTGTSGTIGAGATGTVGPLDVTEAGVLTIVARNTTAGSPWANSPVLVFEQSDDNTSWAAWPVMRSDTGVVAATHTLPVNTANTAYAFDGPLEGVNYVRVRVTTGPTTNGMTVALIPTSGQHVPFHGTQLPTRNQVTFFMAAPVLATATDTLQSLTGYKSGAAVTATTTPAVVSPGKTFRLTGMSVTYIATATSGYVIARLRANTAGVVAIGSPVVKLAVAGAGTPATANSTASSTVHLPIDGIEFAAGTGIGVSVQGMSAATGTAVGYAIIEITGYEY